MSLSRPSQWTKKSLHFCTHVLYLYIENYYLLFSVYFLMTIFQSIDLSLTIKRYDICRPFNKKTVYTAIGSRGIVFAKNDIYRPKLNVTRYYYINKQVFIVFINSNEYSHLYCFRKVFTNNVLYALSHVRRVWSTYVLKTWTCRVLIIIQVKRILFVIPYASSNHHIRHGL